MNDCQTVQLRHPWSSLASIACGTVWLPLRLASIAPIWLPLHMFGFHCTCLAFITVWLPLQLWTLHAGASFLPY